MPSYHRIVFLQRRPHPAGAQTCLLRLMKHPLMKPFNPLLVISAQGWLTAQCTTHKIEHIEIPFPKSRSLAGRLLLNRQFADKVARELKQTQMSPVIVHANDVQEAMLGQSLARRLNAGSALFLRAGAMTENDYRKHDCDKFDLIVAVGDELQKKAQAWSRTKKIHKIYDGLYPEEVFPARKKTPHFPTKILVIGSPIIAKGWGDLADALWGFEQEGILPDLEFHFTGTKPANFDLRLERFKKVRFVFLGRVENFREQVLQFDFAINPSRQESFAMGALEVIAAGVPLLSSRVGVVEQVQTNQQLLFSANDPADLARSLKNLIQNWNKIDFGIADSQKNILARFNIHESVRQLVAAYQPLLKT
jgi:glycosyltransferase involved in cell wall biosynthesis